MFRSCLVHVRLYLAGRRGPESAVLIFNVFIWTRRMSFLGVLQLSFLLLLLLFLLLLFFFFFEMGSTYPGEKQNNNNSGELRVEECQSLIKRNLQIKFLEVWWLCWVKNIHLRFIVWLKGLALYLLEYKEFRKVGAHGQIGITVMWLCVYMSISKGWP